MRASYVSKLFTIYLASSWKRSAWEGVEREVEKGERTNMGCAMQL